MILLVMDPVGNSPLFLSLLHDLEPRRRRLILIRESLIALLILVLFLFFGPMILSGLHVKSLALRIAGGVVLFVIAMRMLFPRDGGVMGEDELDGEPLVVPLATPLIAGPSAIATVMLLSGREDLATTALLVALALAWGITLTVLLTAERFSHFLGRRGMLALQRLMGLLLTVMAVQMLLDGLALFFHSIVGATVSAP